MTTKARMLGRTDTPTCGRGCTCTDDTKARLRRRAKRRERVAFRQEVRDLQAA